MTFHQGLWLSLSLVLFFPIHSVQSQTITLTAGQEDYVTSANITADDDGIESSLVGSDGDLNSIQNAHIISTGDEGAFSSAYGIKVSGDYNAVTNNAGATIATTGSSGRGISISDYSTATNDGDISTQGSSSYAIYAGGDGNSLENSGSITTLESSAHGLYANGDSNNVSNASAIITAKGYGIYLNGNDNQATNSGTITTTEGSTAYGIYISAGSDMFATSSYYSTIVNSGVINSNSHGIYARDDYVTITNSGSITTDDRSSVYGIRLNADNTTFTNSGTISSSTYAVYNDGSGAVINNLGTLTGGVFIGDGELNILGGTISGEVNGDDGLGKVVIGSATSPSISFSQSADFINLARLTISNASSFNANHGITASSIVMDAGSRLNLNEGASISGSIRGESDGVGNLYILDAFSFSNSIGSSGNALALVDIASGASLAITDHIYASDVRVSGMLDLSSTNAVTIFGNLTGSGSATFNVGSNSQVVTGDLNLVAGDVLSVAFLDGSVGDFAVSSQAHIDRHAKLAITLNGNQGYIESGTQFNIVTAGSGSVMMNIADENINVNASGSNISGLLKYSTQVSENNLVLEVNRLEASQVTNNQNAQNIYTNLNVIGAKSSDELLQAQTYLDALDAGGSKVGKALNQLLPQSSKANLDVTRNLANAVATIAMLRLKKAKTDSKKALWAQAFGQSATQDEVGFDDGYNANSIGLIFGREAEFFDNFNLGSSVSYARSDVKLADGFKKNTIDSAQFNLYGGWDRQNYFTNILVGFAWNQFSSNRSIEIVESNATARFSGQTYIARWQTGVKKTLQNDLIMTPEFSLNVAQNNIAGYSENGANALNLNVGQVSAKFLEARLGLNLDWSTRIAELREFQKINLSAKLSYGYDFIADAAVTKSNFSGQESSFDTHISDVDHQNMRLDLKAAAYYLDDSTISLQYSLNHRKTSSSHLISIKAKQEF
jgi:uncharacterized protein with beta-barrel porin domain